MDDPRRAELCALLASGESLRAAAAAIGVTHVSVLGWVKADSAFAYQYTQAREAGYQLLADEIVSIADEADVVTRHDGEKVTLDLSATAVARNRLRVDTRKWMLSKMLPKVYGDKIGVEHSGTLKVQRITRNIVDPAPSQE